MTGEIIEISNYDKITQITNVGVIFVKENKYGIMNFEGHVLIEPKYELLKEINTDIFEAKLNGKCGIIDIEENQKISYEYAELYYNKYFNIYIAENTDYTSSIINDNFEIKLNGIISELNKENKYIKLKIEDEYKYYNLNLEEKRVQEILTSNDLFVSKKDGKYGFVDKQGKIIVDYIYDEALEQNTYGYAAIKKDGLWGSINSEGKIIIDPKYNLDNNLIINFIGKWHLGEDLNMNYYCEK